MSEELKKQLSAKEEEVYSLTRKIKDLQADLEDARSKEASLRSALVASIGNPVGKCFVYPAAEGYAFRIVAMDGERFKSVEVSSGNGVFGPDIKMRTDNTYTLFSSEAEEISEHDYLALFDKVSAMLRDGPAHD